MITNDSTFTEDLDAVGRWTQETVKDVGQAVGLVDEDVIPGEPSTTDDIATHLNKVGSAAETAHQGWKRLDTGGWHGKAADAAREYLADTAPREWAKAADACTTAGEAVARYQQVHAETQARAERAKETLERAEKKSEQAREEHNKSVDDYNGAVQQANSGGPSPGPAPAPFVDPYADEIAEAKRTITQAQQEHQQAADRAAAVVRAEAAKAPDAPGWFSQGVRKFTDATQTVGHWGGDVLSGAADELGSMIELGRMVNPTDPFNMTHPMAYHANLANLGAGVVESFKNPYTMMKSSVDIDGWRTNPAHTLGGSLPSALLSATTAGGGGVVSRIGSRIGSTAMRKADVDAPTPPKTPNADPRAFPQQAQPNSPNHPASQPPGQPPPSHTSASQPPSSQPPSSQPPSSQPPGHPPGSQPSASQPPVSQPPGQPSQPPGQSSQPPAAQLPESQPWGSNQPSGWQQPPSNFPGEPPSITGTREDGGFGPRGSNPEPPESPIEHQPTPSQRTMPHDVGDDVPEKSFLDDVRDRHPQPDARPDTPDGGHSPDDTPKEHPESGTPRHDPDEPEPKPGDGDGSTDEAYRAHEHDYDDPESLQNSDHSAGHDDGVIKPEPITSDFSDWNQATPWGDESARLHDVADQSGVPRFDDPASREAIDHGTQAAPPEVKVPTEGLPEHTVWRRDTEPLYRGDDRDPFEVWQRGAFEPKDHAGSNDVVQHMNNNNGAFVSTTRNPDMGDTFRAPEPDAVTPRRWQHLFTNMPGGADALPSLNGNVLAKSVDNEAEVAFLGGIDTNRFAPGAYELAWNHAAARWERSGNWVDNPYYTGP